MAESDHSTDEQVMVLVLNMKLVDNETMTTARLKEMAVGLNLVAEGAPQQTKAQYQQIIVEYPTRPVPGVVTRYHQKG